MKKTKITRRLSLRAKFKSTDMVEVVIMDEFNNVQIELIPIKVNERAVDTTLQQLDTGNIEPESKGGSK